MNFEKVFELRCRLQDGLFKPKAITDWKDERLPLFDYPAKKQKKKKPKIAQVEIEDISDGKL